MDKALSKPFDYENDRVECNLCHRFMSLRQYEEHYDRCLDISYLVDVAKQKKEAFTREDLENCRFDVIQKLLNKYPPKKVDLEEIL